MRNFCTVLLIFSVCFRVNLASGVERINQLVAKWAPLIWMSPEEKYFPAGVEPFFNFVDLAQEDGASLRGVINDSHFQQFNTKSLFLVTRDSLDELTDRNETFLNGFNPSLHSVPIYATIQICTPFISFHSSEANTIRNDINVLYHKTELDPIFHVTYWAFYPYNKGKPICFLGGKVPTLTLFGTCFGHLKTIGSHVGDWEHVSLFFNSQPFPSDMYMSVHDSGGYYKYDARRRLFKHDAKRTKRRTIVQKPKFPPIVRVQSGHPVLFAAEGSHGLWPAPGEHEFVKLPHLTDKCGYGVPWKTWNNLIILHLNNANYPNWLYYKGKWGNPSNNCVLFKKLGLCEHTDGPSGILRKIPDFTC